MEKNMHSLQPQSLTNDELERLTYIAGFNILPLDWAKEILRRTDKDWNPEPAQNSDQLELDLS
jgi:hypothetical protein